MSTKLFAVILNALKNIMMIIKFASLAITHAVLAMDHLKLTAYRARNTLNSLMSLNMRRKFACVNAIGLNKMKNVCVWMEYLATILKIRDLHAVHLPTFIGIIMVIHSLQHNGDRYYKGMSSRVL